MMDDEDEFFMEDEDELEFDPEDEMEVELMFDLDEPVWRLILPVFFGVKVVHVVEEVEEEEYEEVDETADKQRLVADTMYSALAATVWKSRRLEKQYPGAVEFYVQGMVTRELDNGEFRLYVQIQDTQHERQVAQMPLHEFLSEAYPARPLSFQDYNA